MFKVLRALRNWFYWQRVWASVKRDLKNGNVVIDRGSDTNWSNSDFDYDSDIDW